MGATEAAAELRVILAELYAAPGRWYRWRPASQHLHRQKALGATTVPLDASWMGRTGSRAAPAVFQAIGVAAAIRYNNPQPTVSVYLNQDRTIPILPSPSGSAQTPIAGQTQPTTHPPLTHYSHTAFPLLNQRMSNSSLAFIHLRCCPTFSLATCASNLEELRPFKYPHLFPPSGNASSRDI